MSNIKNEYQILKNLKEEIALEMKIFFIFREPRNFDSNDLFENNVLIVTHDDSVYGFGKNKHGELGLDIQEIIFKPTIIKELCFKKIIQFAQTSKSVVARAENGLLYTWGLSDIPESKPQSKSVKPHLISKLDDVINICCGMLHTLVLKKDGEIYAWGSNDFGQLGSKNSKFQSKPIKIELSDQEKPKNISCGFYHNVILTEKSHVISWGRNDLGQLGRKDRGNQSFSRSGNFEFSYSPNLIDFTDQISEIDNIVCGANHTLLLTRDGYIYSFGSNNYGQLGYEGRNINYIPSLIKTHVKFLDISSHYYCDASVALSSEGVYYIWGKCGNEVIPVPKETKYDSFRSFYSGYFQITHKSVHIISDNNKNLLPFNQVLNGKYMNEFNEFGVIARGTYGIVCKAKNKYDEKIYAIKKVPLNNHSVKLLEREIDIMSKLQCDFIIDYKSVWLENNYIATSSYKDKEIWNLKDFCDTNKTLLLHIRMELCSKTLKEVIQQISNSKLLNQTEYLTPINYYITSHLFIEILEGVNYLHSKHPQIIHRDLKPSNILVTDGKANKFIKICDFGLATIHKSFGESHSGDRGTPKYMAPELLNGIKYDTKVDIYSLGVILRELFEIEEDNSMKLVAMFPEKYKKLKSLSFSMTAHQQRKRPSCMEILKQSNSWAVKFSDLEQDNEFIKIKNKFVNQNENNNSCGKFIIQKKLELLKNDEHLFLGEKSSISIILKNGKYRKEFDEGMKIGMGTFGIVFKAKNRLDDIFYAVKKIPFEHYAHEKVFMESNILKQLKSDYVVQYKNSWIECNDEDLNIPIDINVENIRKSLSNRVFITNKSPLFYIQMELCYSTLKDILIKIFKEFKEESYQILSLLSYFIIGAIFKEILECVDYLHCQIPPIIHRDLKPSNILITTGKNGRFVKIADFGLSTIHSSDLQIHSIDIGTTPYIAPEVVHGGRYDMKADMYSLGVIMNESFKVESFRKINFVKNNILIWKYCALSELILKMMAENKHSRPSCKELLGETNKWLLDVDHMNDVSEFRLIRDSKDKKNESFFANFINQKCEFFERNKYKGGFTSSFSSENGLYSKQFKEISCIAVGSFSAVFKVKDYKNTVFAVKKIPLNMEYKFMDKLVSECNIMKDLRDDHIVNHIKFWVERNYMKMDDFRYKDNDDESISSGHNFFNPYYDSILHIQMEYCFSTLKKILDKLRSELNNLKNDSWGPLGFFIVCELFSETIEGVNFLHKQIHPIIHRDLKPSNILITKGKGGQFIKIGDLGLATNHKFANQSHTQATGTLKYMAPEVLGGRIYDTKVDIYSLGMICIELFNMELKCKHKRKNRSIKYKYLNIQELASKMVSNKPNDRPSCEMILENVEKWKLGYEELSNLHSFNEMIYTSEKTFQIEKCFHKSFIQKKIKHSLLKSSNSRRSFFPSCVTH